MKNHRGKPVLMRCPFPKCGTVTEGIMCPEHWADVPSDVRRLLLADLRAHRERRQRRPTPHMLELFNIAFAAIRRERFARELAKPLEKPLWREPR